MQQWYYTKRIIIILAAGVELLLSCNKNNFLNKKPSSDLLIPTTLADFQALLDNDLVMRETPELGELSTDDFYLDSFHWNKIAIKEHNAYVWAIDIYGGQGNVEDWDDPYQQVFYANTVLDGLPKVTVDSSNSLIWKHIEGSAYFIRAYAFYNLAQIFAPVYNSATASSDLGIPLRFSSAINQVSVRANVKTTYDTIISELKEASSLLPNIRDSMHLNRPSKIAALAMLARVYLSMRSYDSAGVYADSCLTIYDTLIDYNPISRDTSFYFHNTNAETLYQSNILSTSQAVGAVAYPCIVDSNLYRSYADSDLRKYVLFHTSSRSGITTANTGYSGDVYLFSGLATDEIILIRAECLARTGQNGTAATALNKLLTKRWAAGSFVPYSNATLTVNTILTERRKELVFRGLRWTDLRRLNADSAGIKLMRWPNVMLMPNDPRYVLPIPPDVPSLAPNTR